MYDIDNTDIPRTEFMRETTVTARKDHICDQCGKIIVKGERHGVLIGKSDGDFFMLRTHRQNPMHECWPDPPKSSQKP